MRKTWLRALLLLRTFPFIGVDPGGFVLAVSALSDALHTYAHTSAQSPDAGRCRHWLSQCHGNLCHHVRAQSECNALPSHWLRAGLDAHSPASSSTQVLWFDVLAGFAARSALMARRQ